MQIKLLLIILKKERVDFMAKNYTKKTDEEKKQEIDQIVDNLHNGVKAHFDSDGYKNMLRFISKRYSYSSRNVLLVYLQMENATIFTSYNAMRDKYGFQVKKGEKGLKIFAPNSVVITVEKLLQKFSPVLKGITNSVTYLNLTLLKESDDTFSLSKKTMANLNTIVASRLTKEQLATYMQENIAGSYIFGYRVEHVYDISQCEPMKDEDGTIIPLAEETMSVLSKDLVVAPAKDAGVVLTALESSLDIPVAYVPKNVLGEAYGVYSSKDNSIKVLDELDDTNRFVTLVHEYAHCLLHDKNAENDKVDGLDIKETSTHEKRQKEVEAESIAFIVCYYYGVYNDKSFEYIAIYSSGREATELVNSLKIIQKTARHIIDNMDIVLQSNAKFEFKEAI